MQPPAGVRRRHRLECDAGADERRAAADLGPEVGGGERPRGIGHTARPARRRRRRRHRPRRGGDQLGVLALALLPAGPAVGVGALIPRRGRAALLQRTLKQEKF